MVEGQTEETFVRDLLYDHFQGRSVFLNPILLRTSAQGKGGVVRYAKVRPQIVRQCRQDSAAVVTTLIDLYRLPGDFPGSQTCVVTDVYAKVRCLEQALADDVDCRNFLPNLSVHEFEALLFSDLDQFSAWFDEAAMKRLHAQIPKDRTPEEINDGVDTAPSKRIIAALAGDGYQKTLHGPLIAMDIGLASMRQRCPHFHAWLKQLEALAP
ncbi:DUF4276 family protein [uncultured Thiohalocapsa sp.]|uniref:DUF4276 family protein n=1 Tax=uncultured Thiohalocapsa sp. TaxID=768990 RepID=UPI0025E7CA4F|nr:DUF4276 family protein [uncultured Thiohalocapsa sp.]